MCYAVTAFRVLAHAPWTDSMFKGHIRELVLSAIGNGWTWTDQNTTVQRRRVSVGEVCAAFASYSNRAAFPPGQIADLDTAIIAVCDDLYPEHCAHFFSQFSVQCCSCQAIGKISVPLFDSLLVVHAQGGSIDLNTMLNSRNPRLALDRDDVGFSHVPHCSNHDQLNLDEVKQGLLFTLKITSPLGQLPSVTQVLGLLHQHYRVSSFDQDPAVQTFVLTGILIVQGGPPHHFLVAERTHQEQVLIYDNLQGYKWNLKVYNLDCHTDL